MSRVLAIGDIHGCPAAFSALIEAAEIQSDDIVVTLGDYVGKGRDSRGVINLLIELRERCQLVPLLGNHDRMMLAALEGELSLYAWTTAGGSVVLDSYDPLWRLSQIPIGHHRFLRSCKLFHETDEYLFVHASYSPEQPLCETSITTLLWDKIREQLPPPHYSGKVAIVGHTSQKCGNVLDAGHLVCIDTNCCAGGWLTAMDVHSRTLIQTDKDGNVRG